MLGGQLPLAIFCLIALVFFPAIGWLGAANPTLIDLFDARWPSEWAGEVAALSAAVLVLIPWAWMIATRKMDLIGMYLMQNALLMFGYFFLEQTASRVGWTAENALATAPLVVTFNAVGFAVLLVTIGAVYFLAFARGATLRPLAAAPEVYDGRLMPLLRVAGLGAASVIALPMLLSGTVPLFTENPGESRFAMIHSDAARALYHAGTAILPFVVGGLFTALLRKPRHAFDALLAFGIVVLQVITSNRLPLAITLLVTVTLITMERRRSRWMITAACAAYIFMFTGLSGFTSILRERRSALELSKVVEQSLTEAFYGDNLIDLRDAAWVFSCWDREPLLGKTYLGGMTAMLPSGLFPLKKQWHLGLTGIRIVGWDPETHFGLRITFFGEAFLNFGWAGVLALAGILGALFGTLLRMMHLAGSKSPPCLAKNLQFVMLSQMCLPLANTSDAFTTWSMLVLLLAYFLWVELPIRFFGAARKQTASSYAASRT